MITALEYAVGTIKTIYSNHGKLKLLQIVIPIGEYFAM